MYDSGIHSRLAKAVSILCKQYISEKDATDSYENSEHMLLLLLNLVVIAVVLLAVHRSTVSARQADIWTERQSKEKQKPDKV